MRALQAVNITPIVIVNDYPAWATATRSNGDPSYCGPMLPGKFAAYAYFVSQLVNRYKVREFNVHIWEMGNEPDVDGNVNNLPLDNEYGCWGDAADPYYGGQRYGEMLKIVTPVIKAADPLAQVWIGGLLLNSPLTQTPGEGRPELFLQGILEAGVGTDYSYFDVVPYHAYASTWARMLITIITCLTRHGMGDTWGGAIKGKAQFLREANERIMEFKNLYLQTRSSLGCPPDIFPIPVQPACRCLLSDASQSSGACRSAWVQRRYRGLRLVLTGRPRMAKWRLAG